ncbi:hypothetical protein, partial [Martelella sp. HB161492]|uniref:hypothetical protein n=1 Tax=Martelella sp. HB161492 TaxID=2720726 RepID=UPI0015918936
MTKPISPCAFSPSKNRLEQFSRPATGWLRRNAGTLWRTVSTTTLVLCLLNAPQIARADDVSDASTNLTNAIDTYAADPTSANKDAVNTTFETYNNAVETNATTTYSSDTTISSRTVVSGESVIYVEDGATLTYENSSTSS